MYRLFIFIVIVLLLLFLTKKEYFECSNTFTDSPNVLGYTPILSNEVDVDNTYLFMKDNEGMYNDGIVYNSMYYTDNTFENIGGGVEYTEMMPKC